MKHLKNISLITLLSLFTFCSFQQPEETQRKNYTDEELMGKWNQVNPIKSEKGRSPRIKFIELKSNSAAKIHLIDSSGEREIVGKWSNGSTKDLKPFNVSIKFDIKIEYNESPSTPQILFLMIREKNKKIIMTGYDEKFEKE